MKIRKCFVSNSSSSSFIVYGTDSYNENAERNLNSYIGRFINNYTFVYNPETQFGWEFEIYDDWKSKFDWAFLQMYYNAFGVDNVYYYDTMLDFLKQYYPEIERIELKKFYYDSSDFEEDEEYSDEPYGYIDHQSIGEENAIFLEDVDSLKNFILCDSSFICNQNDNSDVYWKIENGNPVKTKYEWY